MMREYALNLDNYLLMTEMNATKQITTLYVCSMDKSELKKFLVDGTLLQICSTDEDEKKPFIVNECSTEEY